VGAVHPRLRLQSLCARAALVPRRPQPPLARPGKPPRRSRPPPPPPRPPAGEDTCATARNGVCDDGRNWREYQQLSYAKVSCDLGSDCADCGPWRLHGPRCAGRRRRLLPPPPASAALLPRCRRPTRSACAPAQGAARPRVRAAQGARGDGHPAAHRRHRAAHHVPLHQPRGAAGAAAAACAAAACPAAPARRLLRCCLCCCCLRPAGAACLAATVVGGERLPALLLAPGPTRTGAPGPCGAGCRPFSPPPCPLPRWTWT
jgi:hypothetical protein